MIILMRMVIESNFIWRLSIKWTTRLIASVLQKFGTSRFSSTNLPHQAPLNALRPCSNGLHCGSSSVTVPVILKDGMPLNVFCSTLEMSRIANVQVAKKHQQDNLKSILSGMLWKVSLVLWWSSWFMWAGHQTKSLVGKKPYVAITTTPPELSKSHFCHAVFKRWSSENRWRNQPAEF